MMAIVGEPSADGLIMEPIPVMYGPLATPLPGGLIAEVTLDGDVVDESAVRATLRADASGIPDPLAPVAWTLAMAISSGGQDAAPQWLTVAALELERAISHLAWLRSLARLLNWSPLIDACTRALAAIQVSREVLPLGDAPEPWLRAALGDPDLPAGRAALSEVVALVSGSRMLRWRLKHRAELTASDVRDLGLTGPIARASGHAWDARSADARYRDLGFQPVTQTDGDAYARTLVRAEEAAQALELLEAALAAEPGPPRNAGPSIEGPRGPLQASRDHDGWRFSAPGAKEAAAVAADAMVWLEWSSALVVLASFDLSPWSVGE
jgi:hypothetical protein